MTGAVEDASGADAEGMCAAVAYVEPEDASLVGVFIDRVLIYRLSREAAAAEVGPVKVEMRDEYSR